MNRWFCGAVVLGLLLVGACKQPETEVAGQAVIVDNSAVILNDPAALAADFPLSRTLSSLLTSAGKDASPASQQALLQSLLDSFKLDRMTNGKLTVRVDQRNGEAGLIPATLLNPAANGGMVPVGLFNRIDLAPKNAADCGEYRIVYAKKNGPGRFFIIFESALPNPAPAKGLAGCKNIMAQWTGLSALPPADRAKKLADFYYKTGNGKRPVIHHLNFGAPLGQVRANLFVSGAWQLREWLIGVSANRLVLRSNPAGNSALAEFYADANSTTPPSLDPVDEKALRAEFQKAFVTTHLAQLTEVDRNATTFAANDQAAFDKFQFDLINRVGLTVAGKFDEFQSNAQDSSDDPRAVATAKGPLFAGKVVSQQFPKIGGVVTRDEIFDRAGLNTCGGCHQFSNGDKIATVHGRPIVWPSSLGFVQINEAGNVSPLLDKFFLPFRRLSVDAVIALPVVAPRHDYRPSVLERKRDLIENQFSQLLAGSRSDSAQFDATVQAYRSDSRALPGYFVETRRTH